MRVIKYNHERVETIAEIVADVILKGGCAVIPTDTCYGLASNALDSKAVRKVFEVKRRDLRKVISVFVSSVDMIRDLCVVDKEVEKYLKILPERITLVLRVKNPHMFPQGIVTSDGKIGVRLSPHPLPLLIVRKVGVPITATSANISSAPPIYDSSEVMISLKGIDILVDAGILPRVPPSTVIDLTYKPPKILRRGPVKIEEAQF